jgi:hypothetical protein
MALGIRDTILSCAFALSVGASAVSAQGLHLIPGVQEIASDTLEDFAVAAVDMVTPVIYYNPVMTQRYGPQLTAFFLAHEYGHIYFHHTRAGITELPEGVRDSLLRVQELQADCYAAAVATRSGREASQAALRFFTRLGPFRFDSEHPTGAQRAARILSCYPGPGDDPHAGAGDTGIERGPVSGEPERISFQVATAGLTETKTGKDVVVWMDGLRVGRISNMHFPAALHIDRFGAGLHSYRLTLDLYDLDGLLQLSPSGSVTGQGLIAVRDGDIFQVEWKAGERPTLVKLEE